MNNSQDMNNFTISSGPIPRHIAIILDGNGRWAQLRGLPRPEGHIRGSEIVEKIVESATSLKIERLTLYCFSSENWKRPQEEVNALMGLLKAYMINQRSRMMQNNTRLKVIGRRTGIPQDTLDEMDETIRLTSDNTGLTLTLAINYGSRSEIVDAVRKIAFELSDNKVRQEKLNVAKVSSLNELIDENFFASYLYDGGDLDPDLFIRTGGEQRLSNYLLWQLSYSELWFTNKLWPDFTETDLIEAIHWYQGRQRRFGGIVK